MAGVLITQTRHGLWGRRHGSFAGKTEGDVAVLGPYDVQAIEVFTAGSRVSEVFLGGKAVGAGQVFVAGAKLGEVDN